MLRVVLPVTAATLVTGAVVGVAVARGGRDAPVEVAAPAAKPMKVTVKPGDSPYLADRTASFSRSAKRVTLKVKPKVTDRKFMTAPLNLWAAPREKGKPLQVLHKGGKVGITGVRKSGFAQILFTGQVRWVNQDYLAEKMPKPPVVKQAAPARRGRPAGPPAAPPAVRPAARLEQRAEHRRPVLRALRRRLGHRVRPHLLGGPAVPRRLRGVPGAVQLRRVRRATASTARARPSTSWSRDPSLGQALADWARAHAGELNLYDIIWQQHIWTPVRSSEGWRVDAGPRLTDGEPLRPRAHLGQLAPMLSSA